MKLMLIPALLLGVLPGATVRFESDGVRVGDEVVSGKAISLKTAGQLPVLVSGNTIENLSSANKALEVAIADKTVLLEVGIRLDRQGESYRISTHGPAFSVEAGGKSIAGTEPVSFKVTEKGFDFGAQGTLEGSSLAAKVEAKVFVQDPPPAPPLDMTRRTRASNQNRPEQLLRRIFSYQDPLVSAEGADGQATRMLKHVTPTNLP
jgi:hypothetical protein